MNKRRRWTDDGQEEFLRHMLAIVQVLTFALALFDLLAALYG